MTTKERKKTGEKRCEKFITKKEKSHFFFYSLALSFHSPLTRARARKETPPEEESLLTRSRTILFGKKLKNKNRCFLVVVVVVCVLSLSRSLPSLSLSLSPSLSPSPLSHALASAGAAGFAEAAAFVSTCAPLNSSSSTSDSVGCECTQNLMSWTRWPVATALEASWMRSAAWRPMMCTPRISPVS